MPLAVTITVRPYHQHQYERAYEHKRQFERGQATRAWIRPDRIERSRREQLFLQRYSWRLQCQSVGVLSGTISTGSSVYGSSLNPGTASLTNVVSTKVGTDDVSASIGVNTSGNTSTSGNLNAGSYTGIESITGLSGVDANNYTFAGITGNYNVSQLALSGSDERGRFGLRIVIESGDGGTLTNVVSTGTGTDDVSASIGVNTSGNTSTSGNLNAGSYTGIESITGLSGADANNYTFAGITGNYNVSQLALSGTISTGSSVYGSSLNPGTASLTNVVSTGTGTDDVSVAGTAVNTTGNLSTSGNLNAGSYTGIEYVTGLDGADANNYTFAGITGNYNVSKLALSGSISTGSSVYGSSLNPGTASLTNVVSTGTGTDDVSASIGVNTTGNLSTSGNLNAGSYRAWGHVTGLSGADANNYTFAGLTGNYNVSQLALSGTISTGSSVYGSALNPGTASLTNVVSTGTGTDDVYIPQVAAVNTTGNLEHERQFERGQLHGHPVRNRFDGADANNYTFAGVTGDYNVSKLALSGSISTGSSVYGSALNPGTASLTNVVSTGTGTDDVSASIGVNTSGNTSTSGNLNAGSYTGIESITGLSGASANNYTLFSYNRQL